MRIDPRAELLFALADDELLLGRQDLYWTGVAPTLEEDVAFSAIAQDEVSHALALYGLLAEPLGRDVNALALDRAPEVFRHARLLEQQGDFAFTIARRFVYELADRLRIDALRQSRWVRLADLCGKMALEETLHFDHAELWLTRLSAAAPGRARMEAALGRVLPSASALLAPLRGEEALLAEGMLTRSWRALHAEWREELRAHLARIGFGALFELVAVEPLSDRYEPPSAAFLANYAEMREVRSRHPRASW